MSDRMDNPVVNLNEVSDSHDGLNNAKGKYGGWEGTAQRHQQQRERGKWKWTGEGGKNGSICLLRRRRRRRSLGRYFRRRRRMEANDSERGSLATQGIFALEDLTRPPFSTRFGPPSLMTQELAWIEKEMALLHLNCKI